MAAAAGYPFPASSSLLVLQLPQSPSILRHRHHHRPLLFLLFGLPSSSPPALNSVQSGVGTDVEWQWRRRRSLLPVATARLLPWPLRSSPAERTGSGFRGTVDEEEKREEEDGREAGVEELRQVAVRTDEGDDSDERPRRPAGSSDSLSLGIKEPAYEVIEVRSDGVMSTKKINRRQLLKLSGLRLRDIRSVDPSLWLTNSMPSLLVREQAILLNLGSLRAIAMKERVLLFDYNRKGGKAFLKILLPRVNPKNINGSPCMPFELEVVEAALLSRIQRLEQKLIDLEPRVAALLKVLPNRLTADVLEQLRISKQTLVELGSRAGALKQMLLDLLEDHHAIRRICVMGRNCVVRRGHVDMECSLPSEKQVAEEEEEEIEMLLENYLQRCESCHGQAEKLLDSAREMEDSIAVNLSSRRLEVSRVELLLQVGTFSIAIGALIAGIFGMNLKSYLEEHVCAFWLTTAGIIIGGVVAFLMMYSYLKSRRIL